MTSSHRIGSILFFIGAASLAAGLVLHKGATSEASTATAYEPVEAITAVRAQTRDYQPTTSVIGTVRALRSITVRNELAGTVERVALSPGAIVNAGDLLVVMDVAVERAELTAYQAQADLAATVLERAERLHGRAALSQDQLDRARADRDIALAQIERIKAIIDRKTLRAPFRAKVGLADLHPGQYLAEGTTITTLQGVDGAVHVDFEIEQRIAAALGEGQPVRVEYADALHQAAIVAVDARVDAATRNATVRARLEASGPLPAPGASVRVLVPAGVAVQAITLPSTSIRRGPQGDHVFVLDTDDDGQLRAYQRAVTVDAWLGDEVIVADGLHAEEAVAATGSFKLRDAAAVAVSGATLAAALTP